VSCSRSKWNFDFDSETGFVVDLERTLLAVELMQTRAGGRQADAFFKRRGVRISGAGVRDAQPKKISIVPSTNVDLATIGTWFDRVFDGILDQRLQEKSRHRGAEHVLRHLEFIAHTLAVAHPHNFEIFFGELDLVLK